jgi:hypothetical protein
MKLSDYGADGEVDCPHCFVTVYFKTTELGEIMLGRVSITCPNPACQREIVLKPGLVVLP